MAEEGTQKWLGRNRPPRVQITYDLETRGAIEKIELPLVVGILADLGDPDRAETVADIKKRKFIEIDRDNFNDVMFAIKPQLTVKVDGVGEQITFETIDDFTPDRLVEKVGKLREKLAVRQHLNDLLARADGNEVLSTQLFAIAQKPSDLQLPAADAAPAPEPKTEGDK
jgi:type VI secretion system protein ImpB